MQARNHGITRGSRLYFRSRVGARSGDGPTTRQHIGLDHKIQPLSSDRALVGGKPLGIAGFKARPGALTPADYRLNVTTDYFVFGQLMLRITL